MPCYVYVYLDPRKPGTFEYGEYKFDHEPFYIGYSSRQPRMSEHLRRARRNPGSEHPMFAKIQKIWSLGLKPISFHFVSDLEKSEACELEHDMVITIGRQDLKKGPLVNLSDGGEDSCQGAVFLSRQGAPLSEEKKNKISNTLKQRYIEDEDLRKQLDESGKRLAAYSRSVEGRKKSSERFQGKKHSAEWTEKQTSGLLKAYAEGRATGNKGKHGEWSLSKETREKISKRMKAAEHPSGLRSAHWKGYVYSIEMDRYWDTAKICAAELGVNNGTISWRIKHQPELWYYTKSKSSD
jgi:hypothetical protein